MKANFLFLICWCLLQSIYSANVQASWYTSDANPDDVIQHTHHSTLNSTQLYARAEAEKLVQGEISLNPTNWKLITADEQTAGIGQHSRTWISPPQVNLYATYIIPWPQNRQALLFHLAQISTLAISHVMEELGFKPQIKWVNDLLLNGKKVCGILCESRGQMINTDNLAVLVGIGINVNMSKELCDSLDQPVTSLLVESNKPWDKKDVLTLLNKNLLMYYRSLLQHGFEHSYLELSKKMAFLGEEITIEDESKTVSGVFEGINKDGSMCLNVKGEKKNIITGRIVKKIK